MIIPVRCFSCGKITGNKYDAYIELLSQGKSEKYVLFLFKLKEIISKQAY